MKNEVSVARKTQMNLLQTRGRKRGTQVKRFMEKKMHLSRKIMNLPLCQVNPLLPSKFLAGITIQFSNPLLVPAISIITLGTTNER